MKGSNARLATAHLVAIAVLLASCGGDSGTSGADAGPGDRDGGAVCGSDDACSDGLFCNGAERCTPAASGADPRGCVAGPPPCAASGMCDEAADTCTDPCAGDGDADGDGRRAALCGGDDCDDTDPNRFPGNPEVCDADDHDEDCDPETYGYRDSDMDMYVDARCCNTRDDGTPVCGDDCDDMRPTASPVGDEICNGRDEDCDGVSDETVLLTYHRDMDGDGYGSMDAADAMEACSPPVGYVTDATDCDDEDRLRNPAATELCDGVDNNCDGVADEGGTRTLYRDLDGDMRGDPGATMARTDCDVPTGWVTTGDDCDDGDDTIYGGAPELCDRIDQDCSLAGAAAGGVDPGEDADMDGHAPVGLGCSGGYPTDDCDDVEASVFGGAEERCDGLDNDCDGSIDPAAATAWCGPIATCDDGACEDRRAIAASLDLRACAMNGAGALTCWGSDTDGARGDGASADPGGASLVMGLTGMPRSVAGGREHSCAVQADRTLACWGDSGYFSTGFAPQASAVAAWTSISEIAQVATRSSHDCLRRRDGTVQCWGLNAYGQLGDGTTDYSASPVAMLGVDDAVQVAVGADFTCLRREDSSVWCLGNNELGQLGRGTTTLSEPLGVVPGVSDARQVVASFLHACALTEGGSVLCWGDNSWGQVDPALPASASPARVVEAGCTVSQLALPNTGTCALCDTGRVRCWGAGIALGDGIDSTAPRGPIEVPGLTDAVEIAAQGSLACARRTGGGAVCWGASDDGARGDGGGLFPRQVPGVTGVTAIDGGWTATCAIAAGGQVWCWGRIYGTPSVAPTAIPGLDMSSQVSVGYQHACAVRDGGELWCWGENGNGQLGDGGSTDAPTPMRVAGLGTVADVGAGELHTCERETDGTIRCFGDGFAGQLGHGMTAPSRTPVVAMVSGSGLYVGQDHACAPTTTGVSCWGNNSFSQLGRGPSASSGLPTAVLTLSTTPSMMTVGWHHTCAMEGSTLYCWGSGGDAQLGNGGSTNSAMPVEATMAPSGITAMSGTLRQSCAIVAGGEVRCWGAGAGLGDGVGSDSDAPVVVRGISGATAIAGGRDHTCAIVGAAGDVWCWGRDTESQLGRGIVVSVIGLP